MQLEHVASGPSCVYPRPDWVEKGRIPCLDGLRAISILLVLGFHASGTEGFPSSEWLRSLLRHGGVGVDVFFVISGFLITLLLFREQDRTGRISLCKFYIRRSLRILPAMFAYLAFVALLQAMGIASLSTIDWVVALTYTANFHGTFSHGAQPIEHLWSLSVEEHFYLIWPPILVLLGTKRARPMLVAVVLASPAIRMALWYFTQHRVDLSRVTPSRLDTIAMGCLLAVVCREPRAQSLLRRLGDHSGLVVVGSLGCVIISESVLSRSGNYQILFAQTVMALALATIIAACVYGERTLLGWLLENRILAMIGIISYSLYLWQQPFLWSSGDWVGSRWPLNICLTVLTASLSYWVVERPFLTLKSRFVSRQDVAAITPEG